jgi:phage terminase Nu1 subunit (DNA packaging protein)
METKMRPVDLIRWVNDQPDDTDTIDRHAAARMLGVTFRTLQRWHRAEYGPPRKRWRGRQVGYSRAQVQQWLAEHPPETT